MFNGVTDRCDLLWIYYFCTINHTYFLLTEV